MRKLLEIGGFVAGLVLIGAPDMTPAGIRAEAQKAGPKNVSIVVGVALLLSGLGFAVLAIGGALRNPENTLNSLFGGRAPKASGTTPVATA